MIPRILVPPGIGDGYWVLVKLRGFLRSIHAPRASVWVHDAGPRRAGEMWERVPFVDFGGYAAVPRRIGRTGHLVSSDRTATHRAYRACGYAVQPRVCGFDYLISFNGSLDAGRSLDEALRGPANWYEPMSNADAVDALAARYRQRFGSYIATAWWDHGFYRQWVQHFGEDRIVAALRLLADAGHTVVVTGAAWDKGAIAERIAAADPRFVGLVGDTDFDALGGLLSGAAGVLGFPAGSSMLGPYYRAPTVLLWTSRFPRAFWTNTLPPDAAYLPLDLEEDLAPEFVAAQMLAMMAPATEAVA